MIRYLCYNERIIYTFANIITVLLLCVCSHYSLGLDTKDCIYFTYISLIRLINNTDITELLQIK